MKRFFHCLFIFALLLSLTACAPKEAETQFFAMDTYMSVSAFGKNNAAALSEIVTEIRRLESLLDRTNDASLVSQLNNAAGSAVSMDTEILCLLAASAEYAKATDGAFDITIAPVVSAWGFTGDQFQVPDQAELDALLQLVGTAHLTLTANSASLTPDAQIDLGGIAKGYASDQAEALLHKAGLESGKVYLGGNVYVHGSKPDGSPWRVAVQDPNAPDSYVGVLELRSAYAVTSGAYQRYFEENGQTYHHIIDPSTGYPAQSGLLSVTVVAPANGKDSAEASAPGHGAMCDAFSTALFVMGEDAAIEFWRSSGYDFDLVLVTEDGRVLITPELADQFEENEDSGYAYETIV